MNEENAFRIAMPISKAYESPLESGATRKFISGVASNTQLDRDHERMAETAVQAFAKAIEDGIVLEDGRWSLIPLISQHRGAGKHWDQHLGWITKATIDADHNLWIEAELDEFSSPAMDLFRKLQRGDSYGKPLQLGLSVGGNIRKVGHEWDAQLQKAIRVIEDVQLREISVVGCPSNPATYVQVLEKSYDWAEIEEEDELTKETEMGDEKVEETIEVKTEEKVVETPSVVETTETDKVEDNTVVTTEQVAPATEAQKVMESAVTELTAIVAQLAEQVKSLVAAPQAVAVKEEKSEELDVSKSDDETETSSTDLLKAAITEALAAPAEELRKANESIGELKKEIEELKSMPVDKSLSVAKQKVDEDEDPLARFRARTVQKSSKGVMNVNPITEAFNVVRSVQENS
jgi:hypothetical protein